MTDTRVINSMFEEGPNSNLESVDAYGQTTSEFHNLYKDKVSPYIDDIIKSVGLDASSLLKTVKAVTSGEFFKQDMKGKIDTLLKEHGTNIASIKGKALDRLFSDIGVNPKAVDEYTVKIGDTYKRIKDHDYSSLMGDSDLLRGLLGDETFQSIVNNDATISYAKNLLDIADKWGLPESIDTINDYLKHHDKDVVDSVFSAYGNNKDGTYNLDVMDAILNANESAALSMASNNPELPSQIVSQFAIPSGTPVTEYKGLGEKLARILNRIAPYYLEGIRQTSHVNLAPFSIMSADCLTVMRYVPRYYEAACIGSTYQTVNLKESLKEMYPYIAL